MVQVAFLLALILISLPRLLLAAPHFGANVSTVAQSKEPSNMHGYQFLLNYDPDRFHWRKFNVYFDGGVSHFWVDTDANSTLNIYSAAPVIRYTFRKRGPLSPYLELSIGVSYLNQTRIADRNLGIHFAFQDRLGIGALLGKSEQFSIGLNAIHYSNAHLAHYNAGITIPLLIDIGYRFS